MAQFTHFPQAASVPPQQKSWISNSLWGLMLFLSVGVAVYASTYFFFTPGDAHFAHYILLLRLHIAGGIGALLAGPWQFSHANLPGWVLPMRPIRVFENDSA